MKLIIAGGRDFEDIRIAKNIIKKVLVRNDVTELVSGTARGADQMAYLFSDKHPVTEFPPDWKNKGKSAGYFRNLEMANYSDILLAFWDGKSKGTKHMIDLAESNNLKVYVVDYKGNLTYKVNGAKNE